MKKRTLLFLFVCLLCVTPARAEKPLGVDEFGSVDELAGAISAYFPKIQGIVTTLQNGKLSLTLGKKDGVTPGMELTLWRDGKEILHPSTGAVIGHLEDEVGTIEVTAVSDASSSAVVTKKVRDPKPGDKARITPKKISLAVIPLTAAHPEVVQGLSDRLTDYGRFTVLDREKTAAFLKDRKQQDTAMIKEMGRQLGLNAIVALGIYPTEGKLLVMARLFYTEDAGQLDTIVALLEVKSKKEVLGELKPYFAPMKEEKTVTPELPFDARYLTVADFEGDGKLEYAFSDGSRIHIYHFEATGWREVWTETAPRAEGTRHINIDSADINGSGRPELFVTAMQNGVVVSSVIEFKDGAYRRIADVPGFLRVAAYPGKGKMLLGQAYDPATFYAGQPKLMSWQDGKYVAGAEFPLPKGVTLYGFTFAALGEEQPLLVAFDDDDHLNVYSRGGIIWKSEEQFVAAETHVYKPATGVNAALSGGGTAPNDKSLRVRIPGRVTAADLNGDGRDEIILPKNIGDVYFGIGGIKESEVYGLGWTGARLEQKWSVKAIPGAVLDFALLPDAGGGARIITLVQAKGGLFTKDRQQVMSYSVK
jgi:hypothetical protein